MRSPNHNLKSFLRRNRIRGLGSRSTPTPGSAAPPQRCDSKQERAKGQGQPAWAPARPTPLRVPGSSVALAPLQHCFVASFTVCPAISNKMLHYMVKKYEKLTARAKSHNCQTKRQRLFSEMLIILTPDAPPP